MDKEQKINNTFLLEHITKISIEEYSNMYLTKFFPTRKSLRNSIIGLLIAAVGLFWSYTIPLSICFIGLFLFLKIGQRLLLPRARSKYFKDTLYLHHPIYYKLSIDNIIIEGHEIQAKFSWKFLKRWQISNDWLLLQFYGFPEVIIPTNVIEKSKSKNKIFELLRDNGEEYRRGKFNLTES